METKCCSNSTESKEKSYEFIKIEKTKSSCSLCEDFAEGQLSKKIPYSILSCEGACLRGEVSRQVTNQICFSIMPDETSRICLGGAFTKDTGQRNLVRKSQRVIALEGCSIKCASRMMKGVIDDLNPEVILVDKHYDFDTKLFGINEVTDQEIKHFTHTASQRIVELIKKKDHPILHANNN